MPAKPAEIMALAAAHLVERGRLDLAREVARTALAEDPLSANAHSVLHIVCDAAGQWRDGFEHARRAAELAPEAPAALQPGALWHCASTITAPALR